MLQERSRFRRRASAWQGGTARGREQTIRCRRREREQQITGRRVEREFAVPFKGINEIGESRHEPFTTNPARDLPESDERALYDGRVPLRARAGDRTTTRGGRMVQERKCILAMIARRRGELIEDTRLIRAGRGDIARGNGCQQFAFALRTHHCLVFLPCSERTGRGKIYS